MSQSEIAQLKARIASEYEAARNGLTGLSYGTPQHQFITAKMENIERCRQRLETVAGTEEAKRIMCEL